MYFRSDGVIIGRLLSGYWWGNEAMNNPSVGLTGTLLDSNVINNTGSIWLPAANMRGLGIRIRCVLL